jgi:hypothetical protein
VFAGQKVMGARTRPGPSRQTRAGRCGSLPSTSPRSPWWAALELDARLETHGTTGSGEDVIEILKDLVADTNRELQKADSDVAAPLPIRWTPESSWHAWVTQARGRPSSTNTPPRIATRRSLRLVESRVGRRDHEARRARCERWKRNGSPLRPPGPDPTRTR